MIYLSIRALYSLFSLNSTSNRCMYPSKHAWVDNMQDYITKCLYTEYEHFTWDLRQSTILPWCSSLAIQSRNCKVHRQNLLRFRGGYRMITTWSVGYDIYIQVRYDTVSTREHPVIATYHISDPIRCCFYLKARYFGIYKV